MSRPNTRSKKRKGVDNANASSEILRKIHETKEISSADVNRLYMIWKTVCQGCRVNTKDNPNCFCGLIPPPNGSRKTGLWQKMADFINSLGDDPQKDLRASDDSPAGLTNLGATCYANSILQCLYMNSSFRKGVFSVEPDVLKDNPVLDQLARLFAQLHISKMAVIDSAPFIKTLELDNGVQQDSHEFFTLLLSLLERCLRRSKVSKAKTIVQDLFRGTVSHVTKCLKCGKDSEASSKMEDFYEVELNVKGLKSLDESLDDYLNVEELCDENQYFCESCQTRVDATRSIKLRSLPVVLNFQLKRCVFLSKSTTKKKITSAFSFPGELDMRHRLSEPSNLDWVYDLSAVLIHKGTAVNSGHYIAHIKDVETGQWWEFDDEHVSNLGHHPFGDASSRAAKDVQTGTLAHAPGDVASNGDDVDVQLQSAESCSSNGGERFSSTDAYMLMYNLRRTVNDDSSSDIKPEGGGSSGVESSLPSYLFEDIERLNASLLDACQQYQLKKQKEIELITERKQEVRSVLSEAPVQSLDGPFYWIATEWLRQWADCITAPGLDNTSIQCSHGKVPVSKVGLMKRISAEAWARLLSKYGGGPTLTDNDFCTVCLFEDAKSMVYSDSYRDRRVLMKELAINAIAGKSLDGTYYVSKAWLQQWLRRKVDAPTEADAGPTSAITCPHGQLMPEQASGAKRVLVPENLWLFFYEDATTVKSEDPLGCTTFPSDSEQCLQCADQLSDVASLEDSLRAVKLKQRQNHEKLAAGKSTPLFLNSKYYLVPTLWLTKWRTYINASGKNVSSSVEPESLDVAIGVLKCEKHHRLLKRPPELVYKRAVLYQKVSAADGLTIIEESDWNCFCEEWGASEENGISAIIESSENSSDTAMEDVSTSEECQNSRDDPRNEAETGQPMIKTSPEICEECIGERESHELMKKLNYSDENISVTLVRGKEAPKSILEASETNTEPDRRASKRSRKTSDGNTVNLTVSGSTSIYQLKMMIWESLGVVKENQILHKGSRIIDEETGSLADWNIVAGDKLWVQDSEIHEHRDIADELAADQKTDTQQVEEGFRGTLLTSNISSEVV